MKITSIMRPLNVCVAAGFLASRVPKSLGGWIPSPTTRSLSTTTTSSTSFQHRCLSPVLSAASSSASTSSQQQESIALNPLISKIQPSKTVEIFSRVKELQRNGVDVTSLCVGEPDFLPPAAVLNAVTKAVQHGDTRYTAVTGTAELRQAIAADLYKRKDQLDYDYQTEIVVGNGAKQCVYQGVLAVAGVGDKVLIPAPYWPSYPEMALLTGATPVIVSTKAEDGYLLTPEQLRSTLQENADIKLLILCNPSNPTGSVYSKQQLQELADVLVDFPQVLVLADEIYERLSYTEGGQCFSFASISPEMFQRTLTINGFSKAYAMTGLRLGYVAAPKLLAKTISTIQSQLTSCAGSLSQAAGVAALTQVDESEMERNVEIMREKRDYVLQQLETMPGVKVHVPPQGAFYVLPDISAHVKENNEDNNDDGYDDTQLCVDLLEQEKLALVPGSSFGAPGTVRISYATSMEELEIAMDKLRRFLKARQQNVV